MNRHTLLYYLALPLLLFPACSEEITDGQEQQQMRVTPINIGSAYPGVNTRTTIDGGFSAGDEMGIFVVDRNAEGEAGQMALRGNRASNMRFVLKEDGSWTSAAQLYWSEKGYAADFYGYYPFDGHLASTEAYPFTIANQQDTTLRSSDMSGYIASDLLWARQQNVSPTIETVSLQYQHLMAGVIIRLEMGTGFADEEWASLEKTVLLQNTILKGTVNLQDGTVQVDDSGVGQITPLPTGGSYRAIVFPQTVDAGLPLVSVMIDGRDYFLKKDESMTYLSGKMHQFTITVNRSAATGDYELALADESVTAWQDDPDLHEGLVRQYLVVELTEAGTLAAKLAGMGKNPAELLALKVVGPMNGDDYQTINQMKKLTHLNLIKAIPEGERLYGIEWIPLEKVFFPEKNLKYLDGFNETHLSGSLVIPEGVEEVAGFWGNNYTGTLTLPSTLKVLRLCIDPFKGDIAIPEGLEVWEPTGFGGSKLTGTLNLPSTLKKIKYLPTGMTGTINIPQGCEITGMSAFEESQCTALVLPEGMTTIPHRAFHNSEIRGEVRIPSTVTTIVSHAFNNTKMSRLILPDGLKEIEEAAFANNSRLQGTITIPKKTIRLSQSCFSNCPMLTGIVFHKDVAVIDCGAFAGCNNLNSIVCEGEEPPFVVDGAFDGVPKDNFTVEVPVGCVEKYRNAIGWREFKRIAEYSNFVCRPAQAQALNAAHSEQLTLNADDDWTVASKPDWVTLSATSGSGKTSLSLAFQPLSKGAGNRTGEIVFQVEHDGKTVSTSCAVAQYDYQYDEDYCLQLQMHKKGRGIDIVFVGDGWDGASISDGSYLDLVKYQTECFFAIEPYRWMREYFNVYVTFPLSQEKGVNTMSHYVNNRFGTLQGWSSLIQGSQVGSTSTQLIMETDEVQDYVLEKTPVVQDNLWRTLVIAVPNSSDYEGNTVFENSGMAISICPPSEQAYPRDTRGTIQHEAGGHGFGKLGDEMISRNAFAPNSVKQLIEDMHGRGWFDNLAATGKLHDVPWAQFIFDPDYSNYVDVYEGGYGYTRGVYRPEANSCMNYGIPYYNTPSRLSIYKRIKNYAGDSWWMGEFRQVDTFEWGTTTVTRSPASGVSPAFDKNVDGLQPITSGNHHLPTIVRFSEVGSKVRKIRKELKTKELRRYE